MMRVLSLVPRAAQPPDPRLIELLENVLERVRSGEIKAAAIVTVGVDACSGWEGVEGDPARAVQLGGGLLALFHRYGEMLAGGE